MSVAVVWLTLLPGVNGVMHTVFSTECTSYFDWQSVAMFYSHDQVMQPGYITRLMACDHPEGYSGLDIGPTYVHPNYAKSNLISDHYPPYNKPGSLHHWLFENPYPPEADHVLVIEPDMVFRKPIDCERELKVRPGVVASAPYSYLVGTENGMADQFVRPDALDKLDQVGGFYCFRMDDLKKVVPLWLNFTRAVRKQPELYWKIKGVGQDYPTGDAFVERGHAPWISEMYGYIFAAAEAGLRHTVREDVVLFSGLAPRYEPTLIHYGLYCSAGTLTFNKLSYKSGFNVRSCGQYFPEPPELDSLRDAKELGTELVCVEQVSVLNEALCEYRRRTCCDYETVEFGCHNQQRRWSAKTEDACARSCCSRGDKCSHYTFDARTQECMHSHFSRGQCKDGEFALDGRDAPKGRRKVPREADCPSPSWSDVQKMQDEENVMGGTSDCADRSPLCKDWAAASECVTNPGFMLEECPETCRVEGCWNKHYHCAQWAGMGQCEDNFQYMVETCPAACRERRRKLVEEHAAELVAAHERRRRAMEEQQQGRETDKEAEDEEIAEEEEDEEEDERDARAPARGRAEPQAAEPEEYRPARAVTFNAELDAERRAASTKPEVKTPVETEDELEVAWGRVAAAVAATVALLGCLGASCLSRMRKALRRTAKRAVFVKEV